MEESLEGHKRFSLANENVASHSSLLCIGIERNSA